MYYHLVSKLSYVVVVVVVKSKLLVKTRLLARQSSQPLFLFCAAVKAIIQGSWPVYGCHVVIGEEGLAISKGKNVARFAINEGRAGREIAQGAHY